MADDELDRRYEVYRDNFTRKQNDKFFQKHKDDEWYVLFKVILMQSLGF